MERSTPHRIRVVVADDSPVMRRMIGDVLRAAAGIDVVGEAVDGDEAIDRCTQLRPDVLTLDLSMPNTTGLDVLERLRATRSSVRVVVVSSFSPMLIERAFDVLDAGATDLVAKPKVGESFHEFGMAVTRAVIASAPTRRVVDATARVAVPRPSRIASHDGRVLVIASSTGGPRALGGIIPKLGTEVGAGAVIIQHMPLGFTEALARRLNAATALHVREAVAGDSLDKRTILVAPAGSHLRFRGAGASLEQTGAVGGVMPRADLTIADLAAEFRDRLVLVVLTGMGNDGLEGARAVRAAGGIVLAQDEADCVVYGMPRHVIEHDLADATGTVDELPLLIERALGTPVSRR